MKDFPGNDKLQEIPAVVLGCWLAPHTPLHSTLLPELQPQDTPRSHTEGTGMGTVSYTCLQQEGTWKQGVAWENAHKRRHLSTCSNKEEAMYPIPRLIAPNRAAGHV